MDIISKHYGHIYQKNIENVKNNFIIKDNGRIVSHTGVFPLEVLVGRSILKVEGIGYSKELPQADFDPAHVRTIGQWGCGTAQIFFGVSPEMHEKFP